MPLVFNTAFATKTTTYAKQNQKPFSLYLYALAVDTLNVAVIYVWRRPSLRKNEKCKCGAHQAPPLCRTPLHVVALWVAGRKYLTRTPRCSVCVRVRVKYVYVYVYVTGINKQRTLSHSTCVLRAAPQETTAAAPSPLRRRRCAAVLPRCRAAPRFRLLPRLRRGR